MPGLVREPGYVWAAWSGAAVWERRGLECWVWSMGPPPGPALTSALWPPVYRELRPGNPGTGGGPGEVSSSWARDNMGSRLGMVTCEAWSHDGQLT